MESSLDSSLDLVYVLFRLIRKSKEVEMRRTVISILNELHDQLCEGEEVCLRCLDVRLERETRPLYQWEEEEDEEEEYVFRGD